MKFSSKERLGLRAMTELGRYWGNGPVSLRVIASAQALPLSYLGRIAGVLRRGGLITSVRGAHGGYQLALAPDQISVGDIFRALEGDLTSLDCLRADGGTCDRKASCATRSVWEQVEQRLVQTLDAIRLKELVEKSSCQEICPEKGVDCVQNSA